MAYSKDGETVGIMLRVPVRVLAVFSAIANRENAVDLEKGGRGRKTAQDVIRERLEVQPEVVAELSKDNPVNT